MLDFVFYRAHGIFSEAEFHHQHGGTLSASHFSNIFTHFSSVWKNNWWTLWVFILTSETGFYLWLKFIESTNWLLVGGVTQITKFRIARMYSFRIQVRIEHFHVTSTGALIGTKYHLHLQLWRLLFRISYKSHCVWRSF